MQTVQAQFNKKKVENGKSIKNLKFTPKITC